MPSMQTLVIITVVVLALLVLVWTFMRFSMGHGARPLLRGIGAILALAGLYFSGLALLAGNGIASIVNWAQRTTLSTTMVVGLSLLGVGLLFWLVGTLLRPRSREDLAARRQSRKGSVETPAATQVASRTTTAAPVTTGGATSTAVSDEDKEIEALLRNRGIE